MRDDEDREITQVHAQSEPGACANTMLADKTLATFAPELILFYGFLFFQQLRKQRTNQKNMNEINDDS